MPIVNGTFDIDLSGWTVVEQTGNSDAIWDNGRLRLRVFRCSTIQIDQSFVVDKPILTFDWQNCSDGWHEYPYWQILVNGVVVKQSGPDRLAAYSCFTGTDTIELWQYLGTIVTLRFAIIISPWCHMGDHWNTYLWVDNVRLIDVASGNISFSSTPQGAKIIIDESDTTKITPDTITVPVGTRSYRLEKFGYHPAIGTIDVITNQTVAVSAILSPMETSCAEFNSIPKGAKIYINGYDMGEVTPAKVCGIPVGQTHTFKLDGTFTMTEKDKGCQHFMSVPQFAKIYIDGVYTGQLTPEKICNISLGTHTFSIVGVLYMKSKGGPIEVPPFGAPPDKTPPFPVPPEITPPWWMV